MVDTREYLPAGTKIKLDTGNVYKITGEPVGCGGGSILYPAQRLVFHDGSAQPDGFFYVLKECYPVSGTYSFVRNENGEIVPENRNDDSEYYLSRAQKLLLKEDRLSRAIYQTASRMVPTRESASQIAMEIPGKTATAVSNTVTVMESLSEKGRSIAAWLKEKRRFSPFETFRIIQQLLFALKEIHQAGYLHLDIQDGNVFLKGTLEQKDELVTLIDFGSARPMVDGRTAPIQDKVIFTTPGFAAPEMILRNDGTLQLGAETDLYSVGCLALYLLTGTRPDTRALLENRTGIYLKPNQLRRIKCSRHLVDRMQQILAKALERNPHKRYYSADEMLRDVTDLVEALRPYRTDLAAVKYDAFICYKHGPIDSEAAVTLQRELENYRAPKGISKSRKPFKRVFVDEGELSSCADFGQQIREALQNSGWLIVVCSEDTPNSPWVQLEIDMFLETHSRSRVLCVMTGGDEKISFPPQLKGNQTDGGEVLAADARGSDIRDVKKKLRKDALLKIAAPMLGTTFDSLKQRHKLYQMQRITAVTAGILTVTAGFAAYAVNRAHVIAEQAVRIEQEYENALINESLFLAEQAQKRLDDNDPLGAMELALQALPSEEQDRPVLTEVEYVLGKALGIYTTPDSVRNTVTPVGIFESAYRKFFLSLDGKYLITYDDDEEGIQVADTETMSVVQQINLERWPWQVSSDYLLPQNRIIIPTVIDQLIDENLSCIDYLTGEILWAISIEDMIGASVIQDRTKVFVISGENGDYLEYNPTADDVQELKISIFSADSGELLDYFSVKLNGRYSIDPDFFISPNGDWLVFSANADGTDSIFQAYNAIFAVSLKTGECRKLTNPDAYLCTARIHEGRLFTIRSTGEYYVFDYQRMGLELVTYLLESYDLKTGKVQWSIPYQSYDAYAFESLTTSIPVQYVIDQVSRNGILYVFSNLCVLIDAETGNAVKKYNMNSAILDVSCNREGFQAVCADGSRYTVKYQDDMIGRIGLINDRITACCRNDTTYFVQNCLQYETDYSISKYEFEKYDDSYVQLAGIENEAWGIFYNYCTADDGYQFVLAQSNKVCIIDTPCGEDRVYDIPSEYEFSPSNALGFSPDRTRLYWEQYDFDDETIWIGNKQYYCLDLKTGQTTHLIQPQKPTEDMRVSDTAFDGENLFFVASEYQNMDDIITVWSWDLEKNKLEELYRSTVDDGLGSIVSSSLLLNEDATGLWFATQEREYDYQPFVESKPVKSQAQLVYLDLTIGKATKILLDLPPETQAYLSDDGWYWWDDAASIAAVVFDNVLYVMDTEGNLKFQTSGDDNIEGIWFSPDCSSLFVLSQDSVLKRFDIYDGSLLSRIELGQYSEYFRSVSFNSFRWEFYDSGIMTVSIDEECILIDISENAMKIKTTIDQYFAYDSQNDRYLVAVVDDVFDTTAIGYFPRYTVDDLIRKANEILS